MSEELEEELSGQGVTTIGMSRGDSSQGNASDGRNLQEARHILLLGPIWRAVDDVTCANRFDAGGASDANVLLVTLTEPADERVSVLREHLETLPPQIKVVSASDELASDVSISTPEGQTSVSIDVVDDPSDLPRLGMRIQETAASFESDRPTLVCFHSLTALLQYADTQRVFRFLHIMQNAVDARTHFHMDANSHDTRTIETLKQLFDAVIEFDGEGNEIVTR